MVVLRVSMHCNGCARKVEKHISKMEGESNAIILSQHFFNITSVAFTRPFLTFHIIYILALYHSNFQLFLCVCIKPTLPCLYLRTWLDNVQLPIQKDESNEVNLILNLMNLFFSHWLTLQDNKLSE